MNQRSHNDREIRDALAQGQQVWALDTDTGDDDVLIGLYDEVLHDVLVHHELDQLPENWSLDQVFEEEPRVTDRAWGDVTDGNHEKSAPYYALVGGCPLPIAMLEESWRGRVARKWMAEWLAVCGQDPDRMRFESMLFFWSPKED
mgnify:CR=1 FL=1